VNPDPIYEKATTLTRIVETYHNITKTTNRKELTCTEKLWAMMNYELDCTKYLTEVYGWAKKPALVTKIGTGAFIGSTYFKNSPDAK
jgi:hypothetical protein